MSERRTDEQAEIVKQQARELLDGKPGWHLAPTTDSVIRNLLAQLDASLSRLEDRQQETSAIVDLWRQRLHESEAERSALTLALREKDQLAETWKVQAEIDRRALEVLAARTHDAAQRSASLQAAIRTVIEEYPPQHKADCDFYQTVFRDDILGRREIRVVTGKPCSCGLAATLRLLLDPSRAESEQSST